MHRLDEVVDTLLVLQKKHRIRFDVWLVVKRDHAIISFFDQGMNPAVPRVAYWTPFRYPLLLNLASLFDNELAEKRGVPASKPMMEGPHLCSVRSAVSCLRAFIPWGTAVTLN